MSDAAATYFWAGCAAGELRFQRCAACGRAQFYPRPFCASCGGEPCWEVSAGRGTVYSVTTVARAPTPEFAALAPYAIALVDLDEGFRMMTHAAPGLAIGSRVRIGFHRLGERMLPRAERE
ncbi:MAG TPA: OB-fold domain-containing protein [Stellaceae bacterium]|nr:OB-fold domain-containing protein [Stellaceae bacterium]